MPITNSSDLLVGLAAGPKLRVIKLSATSEGAGTMHSLWKVAGQPAAGANPPAFSAGSGYVPIRTTLGALPLINPTSPALAYLALLTGRIAVAGGVMLYDRLWACSGFSTVSTSAQSVTTPGNLPSGRDPNAGLDVEPWGEIYTAPGATGATWTLTGVDAAGNTARTWTYVHPANAETVGQMVMFLPGGASPAATLGIRQVTSLTCSVSSGTAGDLGITLLRQLGTLSAVAAQVWYAVDAYQIGLPLVFDDACLALAVLCTATTTGVLDARVGVAHK